jgi:hypothetical protein
MDELLKKLLAADVLTEETKKDLESAITKHINEQVEAAKAQASAEVRLEIKDEYVRDRDTLIEAIDSKVNEYLAKEMHELKEDIEKFRDLEAEYAEKLVEAKREMASELKSDLGQLVDQLDKFLEMRLVTEMSEFRSDLEKVKKVQFGRKMFEAFVEEYKKNFADDESAEGRLAETEQRLTDALDQLEKSEKKLSSMLREQKMNNVLKPLSGRQREVMEAILKSVATEKLEEGYKTFIGRVIKETATPEKTSEKEDKVLAEGKQGDKKQPARDMKKIAEKAVVKTGDKKEVLTESDKGTKQSNSNVDWVRKVAGIN